MKQEYGSSVQTWVTPPPYSAKPVPLAIYGYTSPHGVIVIDSSLTAPTVGAAALRLRQLASPITHLVVSPLTLAGTGSVQAIGWPRPHDGWILELATDPAIYPHFLFLAGTDPVRGTSPPQYPLAIWDGSHWQRFGLTVRDSIDVVGPFLTTNNIGEMQPSPDDIAAYAA